jgi:lipopolysaccharide transport system ATP-binding protein
VSKLDPMLALSVGNVSKTFPLHGSSADLFNEIMFNRATKHATVLRNINFDVPKGEIVGIIGRNGAGKSTLLKIITGTLKPTRGRVRANGRISSILELGTGFHADRTGRENILVGGLCMGFTKREIEERMDDIIAFADLGDKIDNPIRTYSTGMKARLAFSVATAVEPDILIVDEALSVGDAKFERKCYARFDEYKARGCTILLVTHATFLVETICDRAIYIEHGMVVADGKPKPVVAEYMKNMFGSQTALEYHGTAEGENAVVKRYGTGEAEIFEFGIYDDQGRKVERLQTKEHYRIEVKVRCNADRLDVANVGITIKTTQGVTVFAINPIMAEKKSPSMRHGEVLTVSCGIQANLGVSDYFVTFGVWSPGHEEHFDRITDALHFRVIGSAGLRESIANLHADYQYAIEADIAESA